MSAEERTMSQDEKGADVASQLDHAEQGYAKVNVEATVPSPSLGAPEAPAASSKGSEGPCPSPSKERTLLAEVEEELEREFHAFEHGYMVFWRRFIGVGKKKVGWLESLRNMVFASWINVFFIFLPFAWACHFMNTDGKWPHELTFALCFLAIVPMENIFDWGGEQMAIYLGKELGELVIITLNNYNPVKEMRIAFITIYDRVVILHLLLIPGTAFLAGGAHIWEQNLHPHPTELNHSLLAIGVLTILLPTAWFAALDRGAQSVTSAGTLDYSGNLLTDHTRQHLLRMSRGIAVILLLVYVALTSITLGTSAHKVIRYVASRIFVHDPPGKDNALQLAPDAPEELKAEEQELHEAQPLTNVWACMLMLAVTVALMATTAEFLVESIEDVRESGGIQEEWFGLILLPIVSFAADGCMALAFFSHKVLRHVMKLEEIKPEALAKARAIDLSIQFTLFWMPFLVLLGWWIDKPMHLMFDFFELALLLGSSFLVNYVTADSKTNWVEGLIMVSFYFMIAICAWFYEGQPELEIMLNCPGSVAAKIAEEAAEGAGEGTGAVVARFVKAAF
ncbi:hypothetical protein EIP86_000087 [Pleurotus ostreatoroseus]|nr:hypothetical protein EIP86_000087 [Pleurotus ostreatoroseus]